MIKDFRFDVKSGWSSVVLLIGKLLFGLSSLAIGIYQSTWSLIFVKGRLHFAILCLTIDILEYVFNWRVQQTADLIGLGLSLVYTCYFVPCDWHLGVCVKLARVSSRNYSESQADAFLHRLSWVYYIHQDDNHNVQNCTCKRPFTLQITPKLMLTVLLYMDYFTVGERVRFLSASCDEYNMRTVINTFFYNKWWSKRSFEFFSTTSRRSRT